MRLRFPLAAAAAATLLTTGLAFAQDEDPKAVAVEMRQGHMLQFAHNLGVLGGMAQGKADYDSAAATAAAENLLHLASVHWDYMWPEGTAKGEVEGSNAKPEIWANMDDFNAKHQALLDAVTALQPEAGKDVDSLKAAFGAVGGACGACHQAYRASEG